MEFLNPRPPCNYSKEFQTIESLGFLHEYPTYLPKAKSNDGSVLNPVYLKFDPRLEKVPVPLTKGFIKTTWESVGKQFMLFDHKPAIQDFPKKEFEWAFTQMVNLFEVLGVRSRVIDADQVEWNLQATNGFGRAQTGYRTKLDFLTKNQEEVDAFWNDAHRMENVHMLWKVSGKEEYLDLEKITKGDQRCFEIPDVLMLSYALRLNQSFNKQLYSNYEDLPIKVGIGFQRGGFHRFLSKLEGSCQLFDTSDVRKWDKWYSGQIREYCLRARLALFDPTNTMKFEEFEARMRFCYEQSLKPYCVLPWKQVVQILYGYMMSGDWNTTADNSMGHLMLRFAYLKFHLPRLRTYHDALSIHKPNLYSDDSLNGWKGDATGNFLALFENRNEFYNRCGLELKKEDDKVSKSLIGLTFLGAVVAKHESEYVPVYDLSSIWSRIVRLPSAKINPKALYQKMVSLLVLSTFNGEEQYNKIRTVTLFFVSSFDKEYGFDWNKSDGVEVVDSDYFLLLDTTATVPTYEWSVSFWKGWESGPDFRPLGLEGRVIIHTMSKTDKAALALAKTIVEKVEGKGEGKKQRRRKKKQSGGKKEGGEGYARKEASLYAINNAASVHTNSGNGFRPPGRQSKEKKENRRKEPSLERRFENELIAPDVVGPFRVPRVGGAVKTGLAMDITHHTITGHATNLVLGVMGYTIPNTNCGSTLTSTAAGTDFTVADLAFGTQFPLLSTYADNCNPTAMSIVAYYSGAPFEVAGEVLIGNVDARETMSTVCYDDLWNYPGITRMPIADLIDQPYRVSLLKEGPDSEIFLAASTLGWRNNLNPVIVCKNLPANQTVELQIVRTWEFISNVGAGNIVPYETGGKSFTKQMDMYQDAVNLLTRVGSAVSSVMTHPLTQGLLGMAAKALPFVLDKSKTSHIKIAHEWKLKKNMLKLQKYHGNLLVPIAKSERTSAVVESKTTQQGSNPPQDRVCPEEPIQETDLGSHADLIHAFLNSRSVDKALLMNNKVK